MAGDTRDRLRQLEREGKAKRRKRASNNGPLPEVRLTKPVKDLKRIIRESKG